MLNGKHFYHKTIRKSIIAFGDIFNDITMIKYDNGTTTENSRIKVPLTYAGKENFLTRLLTKPNLENETQITLPRMSFELIHINYDPTRKLNIFNSAYSRIDANTYKKVGAPVPYNLTIELHLYVRNVEDGTQIIEQILPYFTPDYTLTMTFVDGVNETTRDVPITLESVDYMPSYEGEAIDTPRILLWTLSFTMRTYFYGPIDGSGASKIIRKVTANTYYNGATANDSPQYVEQTLVPDPIDAEPTDDYGFTETITEY